MKYFLLIIFLSFSPLLYANDEALLNQIEELKRELRSQNERIEKLEQLLLSSQSTTSRTVPDRFAWQRMENWNRIKPGMSRSQVEAILGKPTKVETSVIDYVTLFYQGEKSGVGYVSGNIELNNKDRVVYSGINKPVM